MLTEKGGIYCKNVFLFPEKAESVKKDNLLSLYVTPPVITIAVIGLVIFGCVKMKKRNRRWDYIQLNPIYLMRGGAFYPEFRAECTCLGKL